MRQIKCLHTSLILIQVFGGLFFPNFETAMFKYPDENDMPKHHFNLQLMHYKWKPLETPDALKAKNETLNSVSKEIISRLEVTLQRI